jgi:rhamnogalacturonyl hydrolase YesR
MIEKVEKSLSKLIDYCISEDYKGYDPYDGLNSTLFKSIPFLSKSRFARLAWIQFFKRFPINFRPIVGVKKDYNPKALGLFLSGYCNLYKQEPIQEYLDLIHFFSGKLTAIANKNFHGACWGYNFDWQAKAFFQPKNTPTVVATTFIGSALLDAYEITGEEQLLQIVRNACDFVTKDLFRTYDDNGNFAFSYSPLDKTVVFNASLLGSRLLSRVYSFTQEEELLDIAEKSVAFCCSFQKNDGSWSYGTLDHHQWIDNFHTGYNLECISDYMRFSGDNNYEKNLSIGSDYYINTFFTKNGIPKYYSNSIYPVDIHAPAQLVITLTKLGKLRENRILTDKVISWTIDNMQSDKGYFYYQINKYFSSRISYMRWAQAWMFYALSEYLLQIKEV